MGPAQDQPGTSVDSNPPPEARSAEPDTQDPGDDTAPVVRVISPKGGEALRGGERVRIEWQSSDNVAVAGHRVQLSLDGGRTYRDVANELPGQAQSCLWTVPGTPAERARIKIIAHDSAGNLGFATCAGCFSISEGDRAAPVVTLLGDRLRSVRGGDTLSLRWLSRDDMGVTAHAVQLSLDGGRSFNTLVEGLAGSADSLEWTVPNLATTLAQIRVVAVDGAGNLGEATMDGSFIIEADPARKPAF